MSHPVLWMKAGVNDAIHVQVKIVKLHAIWIWRCGVDWNLLSIHIGREVLYAVFDNLGIPAQARHSP